MCSQRERQDSNSVPLTKAERQLWGHIDARIRRAIDEQPDDAWFGSSGESAIGYGVKGEAGEGRTAGTRTAPRPAPTHSLETKRKSVERSPEGDR